MNESETRVEYIDPKQKEAGLGKIEAYYIKPRHKGWNWI